MRSWRTPVSVMASCLAVAAATAGDARAATQPAGPPVTVGSLRTEYKENPVGIDVRSPRLGWQLRSSARGVRQTAYQVRVARSEADLRAGRRLAWDSGRVASDASAHVPYAGPQLHSREASYWQVRVWDGEGMASPWSEVASWETGLLDTADWTAAWIEPGLAEDVVAELGSGRYTFAYRTSDSARIPNPESRGPHD